MNNLEKSKELFSEEDIFSAEEIDFDEMDKEHWNTYKLKDGSVLRIKLILKGVKRLKKYNPDGTPIYIIASENLVRAVSIPDNLKMKPKSVSPRSMIS